MSQSNLVLLLDYKHPEAASHEYKTTDTAYEFLKESSRIKKNMEHFTKLWTKMRPKRFKDGAFNDRDALTGLAALMAEGKLLLKARNAGGGSEKRKEEPRSSQRRPPLKTSGCLVIRDRPDPTPSSPPPPPIDVAKQVEALLSAAKSGAVFVKQCNK